MARAGEGNGDDGHELSREQKLVGTFVELTQTLVGGDYDVANFLYLLCERTHEVLGVDAVGVVLEAENGRLELSAASTHEAGTVDLFERQAEQGPCLDAYVTGEQVVERDLATARDRWPELVECARVQGFKSVYAFPLRFGDDCIGAMNVFHRGELTGGDTDIGTTQSLADVATIALINQRSLRRAEERTAQLQHALNSRVLVEQAKGVLAERTSLSMTEAFWRLRDHSRRNNLKLREVCRQVLEEGLSPD